MEFNPYLNKRVQIVLFKGFSYFGVVIDSDENSIVIIDKYNSRVTLKENTIEFIKEVLN